MAARMEFTVAAILGVSVVLSLVSIIVLFKIKSTISDSKNDFRVDLQSALAKNSVEVSGAVIKSTADVRQDLSDRLNEKFINISKDLKDELKSGRDELRDGLFRTT